MELVLPTYSFEAVTADFIFRGTFQPRGEVLTYTNDPRYVYYSFEDVEMFPVNKGYQINCIKQPIMNVGREKIIFLSLKEPEEADRVQMLAAKRPVVVYTDSFAVRGFMHVNPDFNDNDLIEDTKDFLPLSKATIFPLKPIAGPLTKQVPVLVINRHQTTAYHVYTPEN